MAVGTPFHARTAPLNKSLNWRQWAGYFAAGCYQDFHQPEYAAIRNGAALIDVSPLYKYEVQGSGAEALIDRVFTRDASKCRVGQVLYTPWCDSAGHLLQEGTVLRHAADRFQVNSAEPAERWLRLNAVGLEVTITDRSAEIATLAVQGPRSRALLAAVAEADIEGLRFFRLMRGTIAGAPVVISRTGYTGDLGYELWINSADTLQVWDALMAISGDHGAQPCGLMAMDIARIEAGFILIGVDYVSAELALIASQKSSPYELGLGWAVKLGKASPFVGREALARQKAAGRGACPGAWKLIGLEIGWDPLETLYGAVDLMPELPLVAWRTAVPVYAADEGRQVGRATSGCWSTLLKKYIALASVEADFATTGGTLEMEVTVDYSRQRAPARVVDLPFHRPARMRA